MPDRIRSLFAEVKTELEKGETTGLEQAEPRLEGGQETEVGQEAGEEARGK